MLIEEDTLMNLEKTNQLQLDFQKLQKIAQIQEAVVPVIIQDLDTKEVLILGYTNKQALDQTLQTGKVTLWSTSRNELWIKGATSGNFLELQEIRVNCEQNSLLYLVKLKGQGACHTQDQNHQPHKSCFYRKLENNQLIFL